LLKGTYVDYYWYTTFTGHNYVDVVTNPTCTEQGYTTHTCDKCGDSYIDTYVAALGHDEVPHAAKTASCTDKGHAAYVTCTRCDYTTYSEIPARGHSEGAWIVDSASTCTSDGSKHQVCATCGETINTQSILATGHTFGDWYETVAPTESVEGEERRDCSACDHHETRKVPVLGHQHNYTSKTTNPTCTEQGYTTYTCGCGDSYISDYVAATGHSYANTVCSVCGEPQYSAGLKFTLMGDGTYSDSKQYRINRTKSL